MKSIALIGIGKMGISHLAIANQTPGVEVKAICNKSKPLLRLLKKNAGFNTYTDYKEMIKQVPLDGIMILVQNSLHFDIAKYCISKGIHVFVEKPLTLSYEESNILTNLAEKHNVKGQVGYVNRFNPIFQQVKKLLEQNAIGEISNYINRMTGGVILKENAKGWRNNYDRGGGCLFDYGPHCFDLSTYFFGTDVEVQSSVLKKVFSTEVDDIVYATMLHNNKIVGLNYVNWSNSAVRKASNDIEIMGNKGKITANKQELNIFLTEANDNLNLKKGWNQIFITDEDTNIPYYLRGEDFSRQLMEFSDLLNGNISEPTSSLHSASITDKLLEETKRLAGGLK